MDTVLLARLLAAHVTGDFVLQSNKSIQIRNEKKFRSHYLYIHGLIHFLLAWIMCGALNAWWIGLIIGAGHIVFDGLKAMLNKHDIISFITDQLLHVFVIVFCWLLYTQVDMVFYATKIINRNSFWWLISAYLAVIFLYSRLIAAATLPWRKDIPPEREILQKAGRWIGIIERVLILTFILINQFSAIGFLLAAKSVFRFGDLKEGRDKGHTEYVMIGTLLSFALTIFTGIIVLKLIHQ